MAPGTALPDLDALAEAIRQRHAACASGVIVVAIDGRSGSGKSTLAAALATRLAPAALIDGDDFYCGGVALRSDPVAQRAAQCIDWQRQRGVLKALRSREAARYRAFDWDAFDGSLCAQEHRVPPAPTVILEGTYSARPELRDLVDFRVLVRVEEAERLRRLRAREGGIGPWELQWLEAEHVYFSGMAAQPAFDAVLGGG